MADPYDSSSSFPVAFFLVMLVFYAAALAFGVYCYVRIARKAGYNGWYAALLFVPFANIVVGLMFVFKEWPIERELRALRAAVGGYPAAGGYPAGAPWGGQHPAFSPQPPAAGYPYGQQGYGQPAYGQPSPYGQQPSGQAGQYPVPGDETPPTAPQP